MSVCWMDFLGRYWKQKNTNALLALGVLVFVGLFWTLKWWGGGSRTLVQADDNMRHKMILNDLTIYY